MVYSTTCTQSLLSTYVHSLCMWQKSLDHTSYHSACISSFSNLFPHYHVPMMDSMIIFPICIKPHKILKLNSILSTNNITPLWIFQSTPPGRRQSSHVTLAGSFQFRQRLPELALGRFSTSVQLHLHQQFRYTYLDHITPT